LQQGQITAIVAVPVPGVKVMGMPATVVSDQFMVAGCAFTTPVPKPQPCIKVQWLVPAARVKINGKFAVLQSSNGICQSAEQVTQGPPMVTVTQMRVKGM